eukprot:scaffold120256_cov54-Phaeocystis_antarctica.AAC.1
MLTRRATRVGSGPKSRENASPQSQTIERALGRKAKLKRNDAIAVDTRQLRIASSSESNRGAAYVEHRLL